MEVFMAEIAFASSVMLWGAGVPPETTHEDLICLARNLYHEARGEGEEGMAAVAQVTLARVRSSRWPDEICAVVEQPWQFSWVQDDQDDHPQEWEAYATAMWIAADALAGALPEIAPGATHYYAHDQVTPDWADRLEPVAVIGAHTFLRRREAP